MLRILIVFFLVAGCATRAASPSGALLLEPADLAEPNNCPGCTCCCGRHVDVDAYLRENLDGGSLDVRNIKVCNDCVLYALSHGDAGDDRACNAVQ